MTIHKLSFSFIVLLSSLASIGQNTAECLTSALYDAAVWDANHVSVVGGNSLLSSENQGDSWVRLPINLRNDASAILEVAIADSQTGVAIGRDGTILRTSNRGVSWTRIPSITGNEKFYKLQFIDGVGYIVGRYRYGSSGNYTPFLYKSLDLGLTWEEVPSNIVDFTGSNPTFRIYFVTPNIGYLQANGKYHTIDGGITWVQDTITPFSLNIGSMQFLDQNVGYAYADTTGDYLVHETLDGGLTWTPLSFTQNSNVFEVVGTKIYYGDDVGSGGSGGISMAEVDGSNEQIAPILQQGIVNDIEFYDANIGYAIGRTESSLSAFGRFIFKTTDGGVNWVPVDNSSHVDGEGNSNQMKYLNKVAPNTYVRSDLNSAGGGDKNCHIVHSYDNGASWDVTQSYNVAGEVTYADGDFICHARFFNPINSLDGVIISQSNDGGLTFIDSPVNTDIQVLNFAFWEQVSEDDIFFDFGLSEIYYSNDRGLTWGSRVPPNGIANYRTQFLSSTLGYLYGENVATEVPEIYQTTDGGQTWTFLFDIPTHFYNWTNDSFDFSDPDRIIVIPRFPGGSAFLYDLNTSNVNTISVPNYLGNVKSINNTSFVGMTGQDGAYYTNDNGINYTQLNFVVAGTSTTVPPFFVEPDESITFYDYNYINRVKVGSPRAPDFLVGPEIADLGTTTSYILPQDPFGETEWELLSGGNLILDPDLEQFRASVEWLVPGTHTLRARRSSDFGSSEYAEIQVFVGISLSPKVFLQGPYMNPVNAGLMNDDLRTMLSTTSPYPDALTCLPAVFTLTGADAIVDWVLLELRDPADRTIVIESRSALLQRDGDVVDADGTSGVPLTSATGNYYVLVNHRNHLGILSANPIAVSEATVVDLSANPSAVYGGSTAVSDMGGTYAMLSGDFDANGQVQNSDSAAVILLLGSAGYSSGDMDMNGQVQNQDIINIITPNTGKGEQF